MKVAKIISAVIIVALVIALILGLVLFLNNGQSNFYVEYGGQRISTELANIELSKGGYTVFNVKNVFGDVINGTPKDDYAVTVSLVQKNIPDVEFAVGEDTYSLYEVKDFSSAFSITKTDGAFTVYIPQSLTITEILQACYPDKQVSIDNGSVSLWATDCFVLNVKYIPENKTITIAFH